jgi:hypothetical protein
MKKLVLIILLTAFISSCENIFKSSTVEELAQFVRLDIADTLTTNEPINVEFYITLPSGCDSFSRIEQRFLDQDVIFNVYLNRNNDPDYNCTTAISYDTVSTEVQMQRKGKYNIYLNDTNFVKEILII